MTFMSNLDPGQVIKASHPETVYAGQKGSITTTAVQISSTSTSLAVGIWVKALAGNSNTIYVGVDNTVTTSTGYPLAASESVFISIDDVSKIWVYGGASGQTLGYIAS